MNYEILQICQATIGACMILYVIDFIGDIIKIRKLKRIFNDYITKLDKLIERGEGKE